MRLQNTPYGTTIFRNIQAIDKDAGVNGLVEYFIVKGEPSSNSTDDKLTSADGYGTFDIAYPHQGQVKERPNDYALKTNYKLMFLVLPICCRLLSSRHSTTNAFRSTI